jgi:hypothetical protein
MHGFDSTGRPVSIGINHVFVTVVLIATLWLAFKN